MQVTDLVIRGNTFKASFKADFKLPFSNNTSPEYVLRGITKFQVRIVIMKEPAPSIQANIFVFTKFTKNRFNDPSAYRLTMKNNYGLAFDTINLYSDNGMWHLISEKRDTNLSFDLSAYVEVGSRGSWFAGLYADDNLTDFELRGVDGGVRVHRAALAAASPVFDTMLAGAWRECNQGHIDKPTVPAASLVHFKEFIYTGTLSDVSRETLEQVLMLASFYMMPELEQLCVDRLLQVINGNKATDMIEFAVKNKLTRLLIAVLDCVQNSKSVDVDSMYSSFIEKFNLKQA